MKRITHLFLSLTMLVLALAACQPAVEPTNREATATNTNAAPETVDRAAIERELLRIENDWPRVLKEKDVEAVRRVEADDIVVVYPDGSTGGKEQDIKDIQSGAVSAESVEMLDLKVNVLNAESAVVTGRTVVKGGQYKMPDGKTIDISGEYRFVDTFVRRDGQWKLVAGASVPVRTGPTPAATGSPAARMSPSPMMSPAAP
jgi:ketosteroid isomerase-like protein